MPDYATGFVRRNTDTGAVAVRTIFPDDEEEFTDMLWLCATVDKGAKNLPTSAVEVTGWEDLYDPEA